MHLKILFGLVMLQLIATPPARAADLPREIPAVFEERLASLLTPFEEVLKADISRLEQTASGIVLLNENIDWIGDDGKNWSVAHRVLKGLTEDGAEDISSVIQSYRKDNELIHLVLARSIQPDGTRIPVKSDAAFIQTPQYEAQYSLYTDVAELVIIFPQVKPGTIVEYITLTLESTPVIPGEYTAFFTFQTYWPALRIRRLVEMPVALADRLTATPVGLGVPTPLKEETPGRRRWTWIRENSPGISWEPNRAPVKQVGPAVSLSTLPGWEALASWYRALLQGRDDITPGIREAADRLTAGVTGREEIIAVLNALVADDIRYVGLEFGMGGYRPHTPAEVWENRYGDCKDKATLLRALLEYKGIKSYIALLSTEHAGFIEKKSPDYRSFDHAILAVEGTDGRYLFCDPTVPHLRAGQLDPQSSDREVLLIRDSGGEFVRTPAGDGGTLNVRFDLTLNPSGELDGWVTLEAHNPLGAAYANHFTKKDMRETREVLADYLEKFFEGVDLIDFEPPSFDYAKGRFLLKAYLIVPGGQTGGSVPLRFRHGWVAFPDLGDSKDRETSFYQRREAVIVACTYRLPEAWVAQVPQPPPFRVETDPIELEGEWRTSEGSVETVMNYTEKRSLVSPELYPDLYSAVRSFQAWADRPLPVGPSDGPPQATAPPAFRLEDFPLMPSGPGQLSLVDSKFPENGNQDLRRAALEQVVQWFPLDKPTLFEAGVKLAILSQEAGKPLDSVARIRTLLKTYGDSVVANSFAWGEYILATCLLDAKQEAEGREILLRIARDQKLSPFRRGWSYYEAARASGIPRAEAIALLDEGVRLESPALIDQHLLLADLLVREKDSTGLRSRIGTFLDKGGQPGLDLRRQLLDQAQDYLSEGRADDARLLAETIRALPAPQGVDAGDPELIAAEQAITRQKAYLDIQESLRKEVADNSPEWWARTALDTYDDEKSLRQIIDRLGGGSRRDDLLRHRVELLTAFRPRAEVYGEELWRLGDMLESRYASSHLLAVILDLMDRLPPPDRYRLEGMILRGRVREKNGDRDGAAECYRRLLEIAEAPELTRMAAWRLLGGIQEAQGAYRDALHSYRSMEQFRDKDLWGYDCILRAVFINLALGEEDEALRLCGLFATMGEKDRTRAESPDQVKAFAELSRDPAAAKRFWASHKAWWPAWEKAEGKLGLLPPGARLIVPLIPDLVEMGNQWNSSLKKNDIPAFLESLRVLAHGARWQPSLTNELSSVFLFFDQMPAGTSAVIREAVLAMNEGTHLEDALLRHRNQMFLVINYIDTNQPRKALDAATVSLEEFREDDVVRRAVIRLRGMAAIRVGERLDDAARDLEQLLGKADLGSDRVITVKTLVDVYDRQGKAAEVIALLEKELASPEIKADEAGRGELDAIYRGRTGARDAAAGFDSAVARWLPAHRPAWFDFSDPQDLTDPRLADIDQVLDQDEGDFQKAEIIKICLLVADDVSQPRERRVKAFKKAVTRLAELLPLHTQAMELFDSVGVDQGFGAELNKWASGMALIHGMIAGRDEESLRKYAEHPFLAKMKPENKRALDLQTGYYRLDKESAAGIESYLSGSLGELLDPLTRWIVGDGFDRLIGLGDLEAAQRLFDRIVEIKRPPPDSSAESFRMTLLKHLRTGKAELPLRNALRAVIDTRFGLAKLEKPALFDDIADEDVIDYLDEATVRRIALYRIKIGRWPEDEVSFWGDLRELFIGREDRADIGEELTRVVLQNAADDQNRSKWAFIAVLWLDPDVPALWERYREITRPYRKPEEHPLTYAVIRLAELVHGLRSGEQMDVETAFLNLHHPITDMMKNTFKLNYYLVNNRSDLLKVVLNRLSPDEVIKPVNTRLMLRALELAGMKEEADVVTETALAEHRRALLSSWASSSWGEVAKTFERAKALGKMATYPGAWLEHVLSVVKNEKHRAWLLMSDAELRQDWQAVLDNVRVYLEKQPTDYDYYWYKGRAEQRLGMLPAARESLTLFTDHCHDSLDRPAALGAIAEIDLASKP